MPRAWSSDQQVVKHVGRLRDHVIPILADRGERCLHGLLAELLGAMAHPAVDELAGVGHLRTGLGALLYALFQVVKGERSHGAPP